MIPLFVVWMAATQAQAGPAPVAPPRLELSAACEPRWESYEYRFENDSSFGTPQPVPHFFRQSYDADNHWVVVRARYPVARQAWQTEFAMTPETVTYGDDFDTFFQPDGDIATVGTAGNVSLRSLRFAQRFLAVDQGPIVLTGSYVYRQDRAEFHPADRVVTHTKPPSESREHITTRETTISHVHEVRVGVAAGWRMGRGWRGEASLAAAPTTFARLVTKLPDKYPGRDITFDAIVLAAAADVSLRREWRAWFVEVRADADRTWSYAQDRQYTREGYGLTVRAGVRR
jgi:hypothetical protein